jgi:hypothetical protein
VRRPSPERSAMLTFFDVSILLPTETASIYESTVCTSSMSDRSRNLGHWVHRLEVAECLG